MFTSMGGKKPDIPPRKSLESREATVLLSISTSLFTEVIAAQAVKSIVDDIIKSAKGRIKRNWEKKRAEKLIDTLATKFHNYRYVKTLWGFEQAQDLLNFYYPISLNINYEKRKISKLTDLPYGNSIIIRGIVGQGKSLFCAI